jgi:chromosome segregation protein
VRHIARLHSLTCQAGWEGAHSVSGGCHDDAAPMGRALPGALGRMFRLKSLDMIGFKSFADKTRIVFPEGITALVGPNGCGKSNLSDAVGWVLGAQTARSLRGQRMEDFIFGGTRARKPTGFAEVTLTLEGGSPQPLRIDGIVLDGDELEITRKLYRSGESVYLLNQRRCRLMDIQKFLEDAGLGFASYALIAQGRVDAFLTARPLDRRAVIEEAAGITGYKTKRRNAELKLEMAQQNLLRVGDIVAEVERQLRSLKRQAGKARRYRRVREELRGVQRLRFRIESDRLGLELEELDRQLAKVRSAERDLAADLQAREERFRDSSRVREQLEIRLNELQQSKSELHLELDRDLNAIAFNRDQLGGIAESLESLAADRADTDGALSGFDLELERYAGERATLLREEEQAVVAAQESLRRVRACSGELEVAERSLEELRSRLVALTAEAASLRNLREQVNQRCERVRLDRERLLNERRVSQGNLRDSRRRAEEKRSALKAGRRSLARIEERVLARQRELESLSAELRELSGREGELHNQLVALNERLQSLQELELSRSHYSEGVKKVLGHLNRGVLCDGAGTLADALETSPEFERLVEEFLDEELEYILVDSLDDAMRGLSEVRTLKSGKCTFLSLRTSNGFGGEQRRTVTADLPGRSEGVYGTLADIVRMKPEVERAFLRVLPQRAGAIVVSDIERAMGLAHSYPESTFITLSGESLTPRGLLCATAPSPGKLGLLGLKRRLRELEKRARLRHEAHAEALRAKEDKEAAVREASQALEDLRSRRHQTEKEAIGLAHEAESAEQEVHSHERLAQAVEAESALLEAELGELQSRLEGLVLQLGSKERSREEIEAQLAIGRETLTELRMRLGELQEKANAAASQRGVLEERRNALDRTLDRVRGQRDAAARRLAELSAREEEGRRRSDHLKAEMARLAKSSEDRRRQEASLEAQLNELQKRFSHCKESLRRMDGELQESRRRAGGLAEDRSAREVERARVETLLQNLRGQCLEQLSAPLEDVAEGVVPEDVDPDEVNRRHERLKRHLESFGPINMTALKEYHENEERHTFLTQQREDIERSIADTARAIQEINRRSRAQFSETFDAVNRNFKMVFRKLFGGGECGMELLDEEDVLECGIDLYAQPPGKKLQNLMLLSGGEKALTVFALLIGIFMYRPSRFCVLDEVDAALDDANAQRFGDLIREMSPETQFIIVTHNRRTMESADALYGITMEDPGVSKVVSARF